MQSSEKLKKSQCTCISALQNYIYMFIYIYDIYRERETGRYYTWMRYSLHLSRRHLKILVENFWIAVIDRETSGCRQSDTQNQPCRLFRIIECSAETAVFTCEGLHHCCSPDMTPTLDYKHMLCSSDRPKWACGGRLWLTVTNLLVETYAHFSFLVCCWKLIVIINYLNT